MAKTIDELKAQANQIKNETAQGANTSQRIGLMNLDIVEKIEEERSNTDTKFSELEDSTDNKIFELHNTSVQMYKSNLRYSDIYKHYIALDTPLVFGHKYKIDVKFDGPFNGAGSAVFSSGFYYSQSGAFLIEKIDSKFYINRYNSCYFTPSVNDKNYSFLRFSLVSSYEQSDDDKVTISILDVSEQKDTLKDYNINDAYIDDNNTIHLGGKSLSPSTQEETNTIKDELIEMSNSITDINNNIGDINNNIGELEKTKQSKLIFDAIPTYGSSNPVTSDGIRTAIDAQKAEVDAAKEEALHAIYENEQSAISNFNEQRVTPEMLSEATKQLIESSGGGTVTNLADDEDIESKENELGINVLKFADRRHDKANFSGKGYKILRKNIADGKNVLSQEMINEANTVYEIRYDFDLSEQEITIPENCSLKFKGGSIDNGKVMFYNTNIIGEAKIYSDFDGTINGVVNVPDFITFLKFSHEPAL